MDRTGVRSGPQAGVPSHGAPGRGGPCGCQTAIRAPWVSRRLYQVDRGTGILSHDTKFVTLGPANFGLFPMLERFKEFSTFIGILGVASQDSRNTPEERANLGI